MNPEQQAKFDAIVAQFPKVRQDLDDLYFLFSKKTGGSSSKISGTTIQSNNYDPGVAGWAAFPDGTFEAHTGSIAIAMLVGLLAQANLNVSDRRWSQTCAFSVTDADTVAWGAGALTSADGTVYNISGGNTGNMAAKTYIYLDIAVSVTQYQTTTTASAAVGPGKILVAIAQNGTNEAQYHVMQGQGGENIDGSNIVAKSVTANELADATITAAKMVSSLSFILASASTYPVVSANTERHTASASYALLKEIQLASHLSGVVKVTFDMHGGGGADTGYAKVYVNGVAVGAEHTDVTGAYQTFTDDITIAPGDKVELYAKTNGADAYVRNFAITADKVENTYVITD